MCSYSSLFHLGISKVSACVYLNQGKCTCKLSPACKLADNLEAAKDTVAQLRGWKVKPILTKELLGAVKKSGATGFGIDDIVAQVASNGPKKRQKRSCQYCTEKDCPSAGTSLDKCPAYKAAAKIGTTAAWQPRGRVRSIPDWAIAKK